MHRDAIDGIAAQVMTEADLCLAGSCKSLDPGWEDIHLRAVDEVRPCVAKVSRSVPSGRIYSSRVDEILGRILSRPGANFRARASDHRRMCHLSPPVRRTLRRGRGLGFPELDRNVNSLLRLRPVRMLDQDRHRNFMDAPGIREFADVLVRDPPDCFSILVPNSLCPPQISGHPSAADSKLP